MKKKLIFIFPLVLAFLVFIGVYVFLNFEDSNTSLTVLEKRWIESNSDKKVDFEVLNDVPVYGTNGSGVFFDFIEAFETDTKLEFNKIPYSKEVSSSTTALRFRVLNNDTGLSDKDLLLAEDGYVIISSRNERYNNVTDIKSKVVGVFTEDVGELSYYLKTATEITYKTYDKIEDLIASLEDGSVDMIAIPGMLYLDQTMGNKNYHINYYFTEMSKKIVLTLTEEDSKLNNIVKKYFDNWKNNYYVDTYNKDYLNYYVSSRNINDKTRADLLSKTYVYGYVENLPYEKTIDQEIAGIAGEYLARLKRLTNIDFTYKKYKNVAELKKAIEKKEVDIYFNYFDSTSTDYQATMSPFVEEYVVLGNSKTTSIINSFESLKNEKINMLNTNSLFNYFKENGRSIITECKNIDSLKKNDNLIIIDKELYEYYRTNKFEKYTVLYSNYMTNEYSFMVKKGNKDFYELFNYVMTTNSYYNYRQNGLNSLDVSLIERTSFEELYLIVLGLVLLPLLILVAVLLYFKKKKKVKEVKKEDRRKYTDMLTSLKNRNYLNFNMEAWEESKVYPQAITIIDLNNVKYVNDNYGHEAGDQLIVKAASILVNTQLENSEIIRTDGNEFLVYLVGYSEKQVETYCKKLMKEFKDLPHGFGAAVGYSMILDDIKTIDDAINEATLEMRTAKEEYK